LNVKWRERTHRDMLYADIVQNWSNSTEDVALFKLSSVLQQLVSTDMWLTPWHVCIQSIWHFIWSRSIIAV